MGKYDWDGRYSNLIGMLQQHRIYLGIHPTRNFQVATGIVHLYQGKYPQALEKFQQALAIEKEVGNRSGKGTSLNNIAGVYFA